MNIVVDTNILISALIKDSTNRGLIIYSPHNLLLPEFELKEIEKYKYEILQKSGLSEIEFDNLLSSLLNYFKIIKTKEVASYRKEAFEIMKDIDEDDAIFIATSLAFNNCPI